jgi:hypothetical protein
MKELNLYTINKDEIRERINKVSLKDVYNQKII